MGTSLELTRGPSKEQQLLQLRDLTSRLGVLHDAQVLQIKMWFLLSVEHCQSYTLEVDLDNSEIQYTITKTQGAIKKDFEFRSQMLAYSIKWLLGNDWIVRIKHGKKTLYISKIGKMKLPQQKAEE